MPGPTPAPSNVKILSPDTLLAPDASSSHLPILPPFVTAPIEAALAAIGGVATASSEWVGSRGTRAVSRARPWLEFIDLSALGPAEGGISAYLERVKINAPYFMFNYIQVALLLTVVSVITRPLALVGSLLLVWLYFQFFGAETRDEDYVFMGFSLDTSEKVGTMVFLGLVVFWFTAGGFEIFISVLTAVAFVTLIHGCFRKPSMDALSIV